MVQVRRTSWRKSILILPVATKGIFLAYRIVISFRLGRAIIGRVHGSPPALFSYPLPRTTVCSVSDQVRLVYHEPSICRGPLDFSPNCCFKVHTDLAFCLDGDLSSPIVSQFLSGQIVVLSEEFVGLTRTNLASVPRAQVYLILPECPGLLLSQELCQSKSALIF